MSSRAWRAAATAAAAGLSQRATSSRTTSIVRRHAATVTRVTIASQEGAEQQQQQHQSSSSLNQTKSLMALALLTAGTVAFSKQHKADCCGIAGVVGTPSHDARYGMDVLVGL